MALEMEIVDENLDPAMEIINEHTMQSMALDEQTSEATLDRPGEDTCDPVGRYRWWAQGAIQDVELICGTYKKVVFKKNNGQVSPPNGDWQFSRDDDGMGKFVLTFHHEGNVEYAKKHTLFEDPEAKNPIYATRNWQRDASGKWTKIVQQHDAAMWLHI